MLASMGLQDLGMRWGSFAVVRLRWMPSILAEGAFMMFPRQEAALMTREFQDAYARGVLWGIEEFLSGYVREEGSQEE
jgi:N-acetylmuramoyl-L-alanine amidase